MWSTVLFVKLIVPRLVKQVLAFCARGGASGRGTALVAQCLDSPIESLEFFIDLLILAAL